mgnify:CR=1 FL=1
MTITNYGHSCLGLRVGGADLLFDPFISGNELAKHIKLDDVRATHVLLTHGHGDHVLDAEAILRRTGAMLVSNYEICTWYGAKGIANSFGMNIGGAKDFGPFKVKYVTALHSSQLPDGSYGGNPGGFVISSTEGVFYNAGDTALTLDMQLLKPLKIITAALPIGDVFTMGVDDAIEAARLIGVKRVIGIHYNTFPPIAIDTTAAKSAFAKAGLELLLPDIGSSIDL